MQRAVTVLLVFLLLALLAYEIGAERRWIPARTISEHIWAFESWAGVPGRALVAAGLVLLASHLLVQWPYGPPRDPSESARSALAREALSTYPRAEIKPAPWVESTKRGTAQRRSARGATVVASAQRHWDHSSE